MIKLKDIIVKELRYDIQLDDSQRVIMTHHPIKFSLTHKYEQTSCFGNPFEKPRGLWYGFGNSWIEWVRGEMPEWEGNCLYELNIKHSNVLSINNFKEMEQFYENFNTIPTDPTYQRWDEYHNPIDWNKVADKYDGIEIPVYRHECRFNHSWYYGWDVASGCIWNLKNVLLTQLEGPEGK